tara:strand:+ start:11 stop:502 length:492 start_codon:yes stop_codon:yes gene_type:complete
MIQGFTETNIAANISTEDNRIDSTVASTQIRFLVKFINDLDGSIEYCYPELTNGIQPRYTRMAFTYYLTNPPSNMFIAGINLLPSGHWKYEIYEVSWIGNVVVSSVTAPSSETDVLAVSDTNGVVQGIVTKGILNLTERDGTEQVQYTQHPEPSGDNFIYYGQ